MNRPPAEFIRVPYDAMRAFVSNAGRAVGLPPEKADLLAELLATNDLRGVFSHGTQQIVGYAHLMRDGKLNANPNVHVLREAPTSLIVDGDGGLGYFPAYEGTCRIIEKALDAGIAVLSTRNHGHIGAAGIYARLPLEHDLLTFVTSGHQLHLSPGRPYVTAAGGSPMAFSTPCGEEDDLVLDFGAVHDLYVGSPHREELSRLAPGIVFRSVGLGAICQSWGGFLAGVPFNRIPDDRRWEGANQGALVITFRIDLFMEPAAFEREMAEYVRRVRELEPVEGFTASHLPGGIEAEREREGREHGIRVGRRHRERLEALANDLDLIVPWA